MNQKLILRTVFVALLVAALAFGAATTSFARSGCPSSYCGSTSGMTYAGTCTNNLGHGCVEQCTVWRASNGSTCKTNCNWW